MLPGKYFRPVSPILHCPPYLPTYTDKVLPIFTMLKSFVASSFLETDKFSKPPVKLACLFCRASKKRCDGQEPCSNCTNKNRQCSYLPSRRGHGRSKIIDALHPLEDLQLNDAASSPSRSAASFSNVEQYSHSINLDTAEDLSSDPPHSSVPETVPLLPQVHPTAVRLYTSEGEILNAYYNFIHPCFPILPPNPDGLLPDRPSKPSASTPKSFTSMPYQPRSPLSLALCSLLALIPHPDDSNPSSTTSLAWKRFYAQKYAQMANFSIETNFEKDQMNIPLEHQQPFHPHTPVHLEEPLALLTLLVYEYLEFGNGLKMQSYVDRASKAVLGMSLHPLGCDWSETLESHCRALWMTYIRVLQMPIENIKSCIMLEDLPVLNAPYPTFASDPNGWEIYMRAQESLAMAGYITSSLSHTLASKPSILPKYEKLQKLDREISYLLSSSRLFPAVPNDQVESATALNVRAMSRITLYCAQIKVHEFVVHWEARSVFQAPLLMVRSSSFPNGYHPTLSIRDSAAGPQEPNLTPCIPLLKHETVSLPDIYSSFSRESSAGICFRAALSISNIVLNLPNLSSMYAPSSRSWNLRTAFEPDMIGSTLLATPLLFSCLIHASHVLLAVGQQALITQQIPPGVESYNTVEKLVRETRNGLECILASLTSHASVFEGLRRARDDIQDAYCRAFAQVL